MRVIRLGFVIEMLVTQLVRHAKRWSIKLCCKILSLIVCEEVQKYDGKRHAAQHVTSVSWVCGIGASGAGGNGYSREVWGRVRVERET